MSNKVTNIYIDTTGFCDEAIERVQKAFKVIVGHNGVEKESPIMTDEVVGFDQNGEWWYRLCNFQDANDRQVGLWELESIAFRCKQEKREESLPTRNIYIDARKLDQERRRNAFAAITKLRSGNWNGWSPDRLALAGCDSDYILFDIFAIDSDGYRRFCSEEYSQDVENRLPGAKELTYDQLMSLTR